LQAPNSLDDKATMRCEDLIQLDYAGLGEMPEGHVARSQRDVEFGKGVRHL